MTQRWGWSDAAVAAGLVLSVLLLWKLRLMDPASQPYRMLSSNGDLYTQIYPMAFRGAAWIRAGHVPLWNPFQYGGHPFLATGIYGVLYPFNFPYLLLPTAAAMEAVVLLHLSAVGVFMYAFARAIDLGRPAATLAAITFIFSGFMVAQSLWFPPAMCAATWLPLALLAIERMVRTRSVTWAVGLGAAVALAFLAGWPQTWLYSIYAIAAYGVMRLGVALRAPAERSHVGHILLLFVLAATLSAGLMAGQLLPGLELQGLGPRRAGGLSLQQILILGGSTSPRWLLDEALRSVPGEPSLASVGILAFLLVPLAIFVRPLRAWTYCFAVLLVFSAGVVMSADSPIFRLYHALPGMSWFRAPLRILYLQAFAAAALSGIGLELLTAPRPRAALHQRVRLIAMVAAIAALLFLATAPTDLRSRVFLLLGALLTGAALWTPRPVGRLALAVAIISVVWWNLFSNTVNGFVHPYHDTTPFDAERKVLEFIHANQGFERTYFHAPIPSPPIMAKQGTLREIYSITDYEPLSLRRYDRFFHLLESTATHRLADNTFTGRLNADPAAPTFGLIDLMSVRYIVTAKREAQFKTDLQKRHRSWRVSPMSPLLSTKLVLFENQDVLPRAFVAHGIVRAEDEEAALAAITAPGFDPRTTVVLEGGPPTGADLPAGTMEPARLLRYEPSTVSVEATAARPGYLVLTDTFFPGWTATVDDAPVPILRANYLFRAVAVPAGRHTVTFAYAPRSFALGIGITIASLVIMIVLVVGSRVQLMRAKSSVAATSAPIT